MNFPERIQFNNLSKLRVTSYHRLRNSGRIHSHEPKLDERSQTQARPDRETLGPLTDCPITMAIQCLNRYELENHDNILPNHHQRPKLFPNHQSSTMALSFRV